MMIRLAKPHSDLVTHLLDALNFEILMMRPNPNFQWRRHTLAKEVFGVKLNVRNCLTKQLIKKLPMGAQGLAKPYSGPCAVHVDSSTHLRISVIPRIRGRGY